MPYGAEVPSIIHIAWGLWLFNLTPIDFTWYFIYWVNYIYIYIIALGTTTIQPWLSIYIYSVYISLYTLIYYCIVNLARRPTIVGTCLYIHALSRKLCVVTCIHPIYIHVVYMHIVYTCIYIYIHNRYMYTYVYIYNTLSMYI